MVDVNGKMIEMPPKFDDSQKFTDEQLVDIVENGLPNRMKTELVCQGFDVVASDMKDLIEKAEAIEAVESVDSKPKAQSSNKNVTQEWEHCIGIGHLNNNRRRSSRNSTNHPKMERAKQAPPCLMATGAKKVSQSQRAFDIF